MLAALEPKLPVVEQWLYEPKLDGFRGMLRRSTTGHVQLLSRNLRDLASSFPELVEAARALPAGTLLDGEIVIAHMDGDADLDVVLRQLRRTAVEALRSAWLRVAMSALPAVGIPSRRSSRPSVRRCST
jgi:ATP-dependent DNA ligase